MDLLEQAINGATVTIPYQDIKEVFICEDDVANWCQLHGLQYQYITETASYKFSKAS